MLGGAHCLTESPQYTFKHFVCYFFSYLDFGVSHADASVLTMSSYFPLLQMTVDERSAIGHKHTFH